MGEAFAAGATVGFSVISATAAIIIAAAIKMLNVSGSPASAQPNKTATIGFTNAYVEASAGVATRKSQTYAEYATIEPMNVR